MPVKKRYKVDDRPLRPIKSHEIPSYWIFLDTETSQIVGDKIERHTFRIAWTCFWDRKNADPEKTYQWRFWNNSNKLCKYINKVLHDYNRVTLVGHNVYFDLQVCGFFEYFTHKHWQVKFLYDRQGAFILKCRSFDKVLVCLSTTNWFDQKLADLGEVVGLPKLKVDFALVTPDELKVYCKRDVEILVRIVGYYIDFLLDNHLGKFSFSKAAQSFTAFRYRFLNTKIRLHSDDKAIALERDAYKGGRCEAFYIGNVPGNEFVTLDVNSMYPYVMTKYKYPYQLIRYDENVSLSQLKSWLSRYLVIAEVEISTDEPVYAVRFNKKTIFPVGQFVTSLCTEGLKYAYGKGHILKIRRVSVYLGCDLFTEYVNYFYGLKVKYSKEENKVLELFCKYMLNALYGKFGQKFQLEERHNCEGVHDYYREEILDMRTGKLVIKTWLMNMLIIRYGETEGRNAFVAVAAHVTENARMTLWNIINQVGRDNVLYCDTDSIKIRRCDMDKVQRLINPKVLGMLKIEDTCNKLFIGGAKWYATEKNWHIKGIPQNSVEIEPGVYEFYSWPKMTYHLREGIITGYHRKQVQRRVNINYDKGIVGKDGYVTPFTLPFPL